MKETGINDTKARGAHPATASRGVGFRHAEPRHWTLALATDGSVRHTEKKGARLATTSGAVEALPLQEPGGEQSSQKQEEALDPARATSGAVEALPLQEPGGEQPCPKQEEALDPARAWRARQSRHGPSAGSPKVESSSPKTQRPTATDEELDEATDASDHGNDVGDEGSTDGNEGIA